MSRYDDIAAMSSEGDTGAAAPEALVERGDECADQVPGAFDRALTALHLATDLRPGTESHKSAPRRRCPPPSSA